MSIKAGAHGFTITKKHLTLYWDRHDRYGYCVELDSRMGSGHDGGPINTPAGLYHLLRQVGSKEWGVYRRNIDALIRAMGRRFEWKADAVRSLLDHGQFTYDEHNGAGGAQHYDSIAWLDS